MMNNRPYRGFYINPNGKVKLKIGDKLLRGDWAKGFLSDNLICYQHDNGDWDDERVVLETVGQYTGCVDENMNEVFEGDRVVFNGYHEYFEGVIRFKNGAFIIEPTKEYSDKSEVLLFEECGSDNIVEGLAVIGTEFDAEG